MPWVGDSSKGLSPPAWWGGVSPRNLALLQKRSGQRSPASLLVTARGGSLQHSCCKLENFERVVYFRAALNTEVVT